MGNDQNAAPARLSGASDDDGEGPFNAAARAVADGELTIPTMNDSVDSALLSQLKVIAQIAGMHRNVDDVDDRVGAPATDSLGDMLSRAGQARATPPDLTQARPWGGLFILEKIGGGSFGQVYRAWDPALDREVALKLLRLAQPSSARADAVVREGRLLAKLHHPNVINVYGAANIDGEVGIWMEFVRGRTLERIVLEEGPMSAQEASLVAESLCGALAAVHQQGLLHRDIKAANVMRESGGRYVLLDFGTGTEVTPDEAVGRMAGTPLYMAPEAMENTPATVQSDIYSVGVLLFFLVTGTYPVYAKTLSEIRAVHRSGRRVLLSDVRSNLPGWFVRVVEKASAPRVKDRYASFGEMLLAITKAVTPSDRPEGWASPWIRGAGLVAGGLAVLTLLGFLTSMQFAGGLGRPATLNESPWLWPYWGLRSLVAPVALMAGLSIAWVLLRGLVKGALSTAPLQPFRFRLARIAYRLEDRLARTPFQVVGEVLLIVQVLALVATLWRFYELGTALNSFVTHGSVTDLLPLRPANREEHALVRKVLSLQLIVFSFVWRAAIRFARAREVPIWVPSTLAGLGGLIVTASILSVPYRTLYQNNSEEVTYKGSVCYLVGAVGSRVQLFCPTEEAPRTHNVDASDPQLARSGSDRNIFSPLDNWSPGAR